MSKANKAEAQQRTRLVLEMILQSTPHIDIVRFGTEKWGISERGVEKYITAAYAIIDATKKDADRQVFDLSIAQRHYLMNRAIKAEDWRLAHDIRKDLDKLFDLYPVEKKQLEFIEKELSAALDALQQRLEPNVYQKVLEILATTTSEEPADLS